MILFRLEISGVSDEFQKNFRSLAPDRRFISCDIYPSLNYLLMAAPLRLL